MIDLESDQSNRSTPGRGRLDPYSTPWNAPLVPPCPLRVRPVSAQTAFYRTDPAAIDHLVPQPLARISPMVAIPIAPMADVDGMGTVHECNVMVGVALPGSAGERRAH